MVSRQGRHLCIGFVGCGQIAARHARFVKAITNAQIVAVADLNQEAARSFAASHGIQHVHASIGDMLDATSIDVLHVITPPADHYESTKIALDRGIHVFVEKPVAFAVREITDLYQRADAAGVLLCPDFLQLFHPKVTELSALIDSGQLGRLVHVESYWYLNPDDTPERLEAEEVHWSYRLPGGPLRDFVSHPLALALYFAGRPTDIHVSRSSRGTLPQGLVDHLEVHLNATRSTATVLLSYLPRPSAYGLRVLCEKGVAEINFLTQTLLVRRQTILPRRIVSATATFAESCKLSVQAVGNIVDYLRGRLVPFGGMQVLIARFYQSILESQPPPVSRDLVTEVTRVEEEIFSGATQPNFANPCSPTTRTASPTDRILVTGASGYVGRHVVEALVQHGYSVRALVRPTSASDHLKSPEVDVFVGDVRRLEHVSAAADGMDVIIHLAAGMKGSPAFMVDTCVRGTQNVAAAAGEQGVKRVIYLSSFSVYDLAKVRD
jgi:predicted dehydrogenase